MRNQQAEKQRTPAGGIAEVLKKNEAGLGLRRAANIAEAPRHVKCPVVVRVTPRGRFVSMGRAIA